MALWTHSDVQDNGLNAVKTNCNQIAIILNCTAGDSYATVVSNILATSSMTSGDFTISNGANSTRVLTSASGKTGTVSVQGDPSHIAFLDTTNSKVLVVTQETSSQIAYVGNPITFPSITLTSNQPT